VSEQVDALRKREQATRRVSITASRAGEFIQFRITAYSTDRWIKLTDAEWQQMRAAGDAVAEAGGDD
jgi:hypothetical protein